VPTTDPPETDLSTDLLSDEAVTGAPTLRACGTCSLCCLALRVDELGKLAGEPCPKLGARGGCTIHATRPAVCRAYQCSWSKGRFDEADRPDRLGAVVDFAPNGLALHLALIEAEPGAFERSRRLQGIAEAHREQMDVRVSDTRNVLDPARPIRVLQSGGRELVLEGERVRTYLRGELVSDERLPWVERLARRLQQRWAAWRWRLLAGRRRRALERRS